jgi:hypothetical protein
MPHADSKIRIVIPAKAEVQASFEEPSLSRQQTLEKRP